MQRRRIHRGCGCRRGLVLCGVAGQGVEFSDARLAVRAAEHAVREVADSVCEGRAVLHGLVLFLRDEGRIGSHIAVFCYWGVFHVA